jgi:hypothetical protein
MQGIIVGMVGIVLFLIWITFYLSDIHEDMSEIRKLLSSAPISKKLKTSQDIGDKENSIEGKL